MASYKVLTDRLVVAKQGATIDETALEGANIQALIDGGHIEPASVGKKQEDSTKQEDSKEK
jgi:hypothetical protein